MPPDTSESAKVNYGLLYTGILLLVLAGAAYLLKSDIFQGSVGFFFVKVFLSLGGGLVASQIPGTVGLEINPGIKAAGALAIVVLIFMNAPPIDGKTSVDPPPNLSGRWTRDTDVPGKTEVYTFVANPSQPDYYDFSITYEGTNLPNPPVYQTGSGRFLSNNTSIAEFTINRTNQAGCKMQLKAVWKKINDDKFEENLYPVSKLAKQCEFTLDQLEKIVPPRPIKRERK